MLGTANAANHQTEQHQKKLRQKLIQKPVKIIKVTKQAKSVKNLKLLHQRKLQRTKPVSQKRW